MKLRKHNQYIANITYEGDAMAKQAKTLTADELRRVLDLVTTRKHALRNRALVSFSFYAGCRVGEISSLRYTDVVDPAGSVRSEVVLRAENTKTRESRTVFISAKLKKELQNYIQIYKPIKPDAKLFYSQKTHSNGFTANTLTQFFHFLYRRAGIHGASSHSGRRTFITNLANKGISVRLLASLAGHRNISTTQCYIDVNDDMKRRAVELV